MLTCWRYIGRLLITPSLGCYLPDRRPRGSGGPERATCLAALDSRVRGNDAETNSTTSPLLPKLTCARIAWGLKMRATTRLHGSKNESLVLRNRPLCPAARSAARVAGTGQRLRSRDRGRGLSRYGRAGAPC